MARNMLAKLNRIFLLYGRNDFCAKQNTVAAHSNTRNFPSSLNAFQLQLINRILFLPDFEMLPLTWSGGAAFFYDVM